MAATFRVAYRITTNTVIRGGVGRFVQATFERGGQNGFARTTPFIASDGTFKTPVDTLSNPFHSGVLPASGSSLGALTNLGQGVNWNNQNPDRPYSWEYSAHVQHQWRRWLFEVGYSHNKTYGIFQDRVLDNPSLALWRDLRAPRDLDGNPLGPNDRPSDTLLWDTPVPNPFKGATVPGCPTPCVNGGVGSDGTVNMNRLLFGDPLLGSVTRNTNPLGKNQYDAMLAKIEHRFNKGFSILGAFTWSKLFEDTSQIGPEIAGPVVEHKLGGEDRPFRLSIASVWEMPLGRGKKFAGSIPRAADFLIGGWELTGQYTIQSGTPVVFGSDSFFTGKNPKLPSGQQTRDRWFDTSQFKAFPGKSTDVFCVLPDPNNTCVPYPDWTGVKNLPGAGYRPPVIPVPQGQPVNGIYQDFATFIRRYPTRFSNIRNPGVNEVNLGIYKNFRFTERTKLQFRFDAFNAFNHARVPGPNSNPGNGNFGKITANTQDNGPRQIELGAKFTF